MENKYPTYVMKCLRKRRGLDENDTSQDERINKMKSQSAFDDLLAWNGLGGWRYEIEGWIKGVYGVDLEDVDKE